MLMSCRFSFSRLAKRFVASALRPACTSTWPSGKWSVPFSVFCAWSTLVCTACSTMRATALRTRLIRTSCLSMLTQATTQGSASVLRLSTTRCSRGIHVLSPWWWTVVEQACSEWSCQSAHLSCVVRRSWLEREHSCSPSYCKGLNLMTVFTISLLQFSVVKFILQEGLLSIKVKFCLPSGTSYLQTPRRPVLAVLEFFPRLVWHKACVDVMLAVISFSR